MRRQDRQNSVSEALGVAHHHVELPEMKAINQLARRSKSNLAAPTGHIPGSRNVAVNCGPGIIIDIPSVEGALCWASKDPDS